MDRPVEERLAFISSLDIGKLPETDPLQASAAVGDGQITFFVAGLPEQQKVSLTLHPRSSLCSFGNSQEDVMNSTLLAQLAANKKTDRLTDPAGWYEAYRDVLENLYWTTTSFQ
jgi:hypothetical protein